MFALIDALWGGFLCRKDREVICVGWGWVYRHFLSPVFGRLSKVRLPRIRVVFRELPKD